MTTVAFRDGVLAFDSRVSDSVHVGWKNKGRHTKKYIMAGCGLCDDIEAAMDWIEETDGKISEKSKYDIQSRELECELIVINKEGKVMFYGTRMYPVTIDAPYYATGSGSLLALGAMAVGATSKQAVEAAIKHDLYSGGTVRTLSVSKLAGKPPKKEVKKKRKKRK